MLLAPFRPCTFASAPRQPYQVPLPLPSTSSSTAWQNSNVIYDAIAQVHGVLTKTTPNSLKVYL